MLRPRSAARTVVAALTVVTALTVAGGCTKDKPADAPGAPAKGMPALVPRRVPDTDIVVSLPKGWVLDMPDPGKLPPPPPNQDKIELHTRTLLVARPATPFPGTLVTPMLQVLQDAWLPVGTTGVDYLVAQRAANQAVIGANIRHVEAEPSRRDGRPLYHVRDEWTVKTPDGQSRDVSQEALLMLDTATAPDGKPGMHGFTVVITMEKIEFNALQPMVREILGSAHFDAK